MNEHSPQRPVNALTVDVEDWIQSVYDVDRPLSDRFVRNTERILDCFARCDVRATFFVLGLAAKRAPELVRRIQTAGHEVQSHGFGHRLLHTMTPDQLRADLDRSKKLLEDITGTAITGYRAPAFGISQSNLQALDIIAESGFTCDASVCPARTRRYGIAGAPHTPHRIVTSNGRTILELPTATLSIFGRRLPMGGGGHLRLFPWRWVERAIGAINRCGNGTAVYMHPYEFAPNELGELASSKAEGITIPWHQRLHQGIGRGRFADKVEALVRAVPFGRVSDVLAQEKSWPTFTYGANGVITPCGVITQAEAPRRSVPVFDERKVATRELPTRPIASPIS